VEFDEAAKLLSTAIRSELQDHAFGDREVTWFQDDDVVLAIGYFNGTESEVTFITEPPVSFHGDEAQKLSKLGVIGKISRNDMTGPDTYTDGVIMPGLTLEGVRQELEG
jgi:hypothetical protein